MASGSEQPPKQFKIDIDDDETDPDKIACEATHFLFEMATEQANNFINRNDDLKNLEERQKNFI